MSKNQLEDFVELGEMFEIYGKLLSSDRQTIMTSYFEFNMTLAEIAQERNVSRQAVLDAIDKSCEKLKEFENILNLFESKKMLKASLQEIILLAEKNSIKQIKEKVEEILRKV